MSRARLLGKGSQALIYWAEVKVCCIAGINGASSRKRW